MNILPPSALDLADPQPGIYRNVPFELYGDIQAVNQSRLKAVAKSPAHAQAESAGTEALAFGSLIHTMVLEPREVLKRYTIWNTGKTGNSKNGNKWIAYKFGLENGLEAFEHGVCSWEGSTANKAAKEAKKLLTAPQILLPPADFEEIRNRIPKDIGKEVITMTTWGAAELLVDKLKPDFDGNGLAQYLGAMGEVELTLVWEETIEIDGENVTILCKARIDKVISGGSERSTIFDLKSCEDCTPEAFARACGRYRYEIQAPWYCRGWEALTGESLGHADFIFGALEKSTGISAGHWLSEEAFHHGRTCILDLLNTWARCQRANHWPGPAAEELNYLPSDWETPLDTSEAEHEGELLQDLIP